MYGIEEELIRTCRNWVSILLHLIRWLNKIPYLSIIDMKGSVGFFIFSNPYPYILIDTFIMSTGCHCLTNLQNIGGGKTKFTSYSMEFQASSGQLRADGVCHCVS